MEVRHIHGRRSYERYASVGIRTSGPVSGALRTRRRFDRRHAPIGDAIAVAASANTYKDQYAVWLEPSRIHDTDASLAASYKKHRSELDSKDRLIASLRRLLGRWVAIRGSEVLIAAGSSREVIDFLRAHNLRAESVFRVPRDPKQEIAG